MTRNRLMWILAALFWPAAVAAQTSPQQASEARIQELIRLAAERVGAAQDATAQPPAASGAQTPAGAPDARPMVRLSLDDAVRLALERNLDIAVQRLNPQISDIAIASVRTTYHPTLTSTVGPQSTTQLPTNQLAGGTSGIVTDTTTYNAGMSQSVPWGGGSLAISLNNFRQTSTSNNVFYNPQFQSNWSFAYTQPLFRNFRIDSTRQQLQVTKLNRDVSDIQLRSSITNTLSNVRNAYWDFVYATQAVEVARQSLALATKLVEDNQTRVQVGTMAPIDVVQAQSEAATRRQALVAAESTRRTSELALKRLIVDGTQDPNWGAALDPTDRPEFRVEPVDVESAVRRALSERTDLEIAKKNVESNNVTFKLLQDQVRPQVDFALSYGFQGIGGPFYQRTNLGVLGSQVSQIIPGGVGDAFSSLFRNQFPRWVAQVNFSYPLGLSAQEASVARGRVQLNQVQAQMKQIELQIANDVTSAAINVQNAAESVQAAQAARELSQRKLEAEQSKFEVGMSTNYFVVQAQRDLADAQNSELRAVLNYRKALVELERSQQTTLQSLNITVLNAGGTAGTTSAATVGTGGGGGNFGR